MSPAPSLHPSWTLALGQPDLGSNPASVRHCSSPSFCPCANEKGHSVEARGRECVRAGAKCKAPFRPAQGQARRAPSPPLSSPSCASGKPACHSSHASVPRPRCLLRGPRAPAGGARLPKASERGAGGGLPLHPPGKEKGKFGLQPPDPAFMTFCMLPPASFSDLNSQ